MSVIIVCICACIQCELYHNQNRQLINAYNMICYHYLLRPFQFPLVRQTNFIGIQCLINHLKMFCIEISMLRVICLMFDITKAHDLSTKYEQIRVY